MEPKLVTVGVDDGGREAGRFDSNVIAGSVVIVLAGLFIFYRERQVSPAVTTSELTANNP